MQEMEAAYLIDFYLAYEFEMELSSIHTKSYFPNEVAIYPQLSINTSILYIPVSHTVVCGRGLCFGYS